MKNIIAIDVASEVSEVSAVCVMTGRGKVQREELVPTTIKEFKKIIKEVRIPKQVVFEEGTQASWLWSELSLVCDDVFVCDPAHNGQLSGGQKSDKNDARNLAERARLGSLKRVWHGGEELQSLREAVRCYQALTQDNVRIKNRIRAVFRSCGLKTGAQAYEAQSRKAVQNTLRLRAQEERVARLGAVLDEITTQRASALKTMVRLARKNKMYKSVRSVSGIGPVFTSMFISEVGCPHRFRTRRQLWAYGGLSIMTHESSEFELKNGRIVRRSRPTRTRGLTCSYNRTLKYVFKQVAMTLSHSKWKTQYHELLKRSKNPSNAQLTLARKLAAVMLHVAKTGETYDVTKVFKAQ